MNNNKKYTFWELCNNYNKIEIPIIQRDYAQGRNTAEVKKLREKFVNGYLIDALISNNPVELDFVYGSILSESNGDNKNKNFIPLDGQQRLTTLFLLHYFVAVKETRLSEVKSVLKKFTYETRPSAHDFCKRLLEFDHIDNLANIKREIEDSQWFNAEWKNDPTIEGMLNMLETFSTNSEFLHKENVLLDKLLQAENNLITFYFTDLDEFGLTENLYIRMNARGKKLTDFENFKSEFFKIIRYNSQLLEDFKNKIEYNWVENLWDYRQSNAFVIDEPFMIYLNFITEMLYFKSAEFRAKSYEDDFLDFKVLKEVYSVEENLKTLIFALDYINNLKSFDSPIIWNSESQKDVLGKLLKGSRLDITELFVLFMSIQFSYLDQPSEHLNDFIRVVRNLISNTNDNSRREWPRLIESLESLISNENVYVVLSSSSEQVRLIGFDVDQRKEEVFKAAQILTHPNFKALIFKLEDNKNFKGNITNILKTPFTNNEDDFERLNLDLITYNDESINFLEQIFEGYKVISKDNFKKIWGDLLITDLYYQTNYSRLLFEEYYEDFPSVLLFAKHFTESNISLDKYIVANQVNFVKMLTEKNEDFSTIRQVNEQLYLYYIIHRNVYNESYKSFFKNDNYNFGWLKKETGFKSYFKEGISECEYFSNVNPIFQVYNHQFRYNLGINKNNTLNIETVVSGKIRDPFEKIKDWAIEN
ncbi:Protein of unknown function DUF262 [Nonlabens sp. Hel1_33_55]|uniref:DUF262 domain-containing protein n=1 Tax=Nonlabens sp. Hel1_33_55 TaxID=1336802 RepID=UPI000875E688|nr:DUF262 domain-containing protein [Nonlabens sp. Hel1_33_55]SCY40894.1 Protein of unknown function DUF262 [Nonlabens sp. Hel1_33_55]